MEHSCRIRHVGNVDNVWNLILMDVCMYVCIMYVCWFVRVCVFVCVCVLGDGVIRLFHLYLDTSHFISTVTKVLRQDYIID